MTNPGILAVALGLSAVAMLNLVVVAFVAVRMWLAFAPRRHRETVPAITQPQTLSPAHH